VKTGARRSIRAPEEVGGQHAGKTCAVGPVIQTPSSRQSTSSVAAIERQRHLRPVRPRARAATATAQEEEPEASVIRCPVPRPACAGGRGETLHELHIGAFGEERVVFVSGPKLFEVHRLGIVDEEGAMRVAHAGGDRVARRWAGAGVGLAASGMSAQSKSPGCAHVDRGQAAARRRAPAGSPRSVRIEGQPIGPRTVHQMARDAAGGVAAGRRAVDPSALKKVSRASASVRFDHGQLVEADAAVPVRQRARQRGP
jgi:hypothetical protein